MAGIIFQLILLNVGILQEFAIFLICICLKSIIGVSMIIAQILVSRLLVVERIKKPLLLKKHFFLKLRAMSNKEMRELSEKINRGLEIAEKRMLQEKALKGQDVIVCDAENNIRRIPAKRVIANNPIFQ